MARYGTLCHSEFGEIAQLVEHCTENAGVPGSSPGFAININHEDAQPFRKLMLNEPVLLTRFAHALKTHFVYQPFHSVVRWT